MKTKRLKDLKTKDQKTKQLKAGAVMQKTPKNAEKSKVFLTDGPTDGPTDRRTERVIESRARD